MSGGFMSISHIIEKWTHIHLKNQGHALASDDHDKPRDRSI